MSLFIKVFFFASKNENVKIKLSEICAEHKQINFKIRLTVVNDKTKEFTEHNNHISDVTKIEAKKVISTLKKLHRKQLLVYIQF